MNDKRQEVLLEGQAGKQKKETGPSFYFSFFWFFNSKIPPLATTTTTTTIISEPEKTDTGTH